MAHCYFCGAASADPAEAGWTPYFYRGEQEVCHPVCPGCHAAHLEEGVDGEWQERNADMEETRDALVKAVAALRAAQEAATRCGRTGHLHMRHAAYIGSMIGQAEKAAAAACTAAQQALDEPQRR